jgi:tight adherence protein B
MRTTAGLLRARVRAERRTAGSVAGARATMNVLTALPLGGPLVALALGVGPRELYAGSAVTAVCLIAGGLLVLAGRWWVARMVGAVARGPVLS